MNFKYGDPYRRRAFPEEIYFTFIYIHANRNYTLSTTVFINYISGELWHSFHITGRWKLLEYTTETSGKFDRSNRWLFLDKQY